MVWVTSVDAETYISHIRFVGNDTTRESLFRERMYIKEGDVVDLIKIEKSIQSIMDLGLYRNVEYYLEENYQQGMADESSAELVIVVREKYYLLVLPRLKVEDNEFRYGIQLRWDNLHGLNHAIRLTAERMGEREGITEYQQRYRYKYPSAFGTRFDMEFKILYKNSVETNTEDVLQNNVEQLLSVNLVKWINRENRKYGKYLRLGFGNVQREFEDIDNRQVVDETDATNILAEYGYEKVHEHLYNRSGKHYGYLIDVADHRLGSTSEFVKHVLFYQSYYQFKSRPNDNLNVQTILGHSTDDVLGDYAFTLDYRNDLRGYERDRFQGNTMLLINTEYLHSFGRYPNLRYLYFVDLGSTYDQIEDIFHSPLNIGLGFGIRWKIPAFVRLDLRLDFGYGVTDRDWFTSFGTRYLF